MVEDTNFEDFLNKQDYELPEVGDIRKGIIVAITQQGVIVDLGLKRDGIVPSSDVAKLEEDERKALKVDDEISVYITNSDAADSLHVSIHLAKLNQDWIEAEALMKSGAIVEGEVIGYNKGGAIIPYGRLRGFVPASHLTELNRGLSDRQRQQKLAKLRGLVLPVKVIEVDRRRRRLVFSQRDAQKEWEEKRKAELLQELNEGDVLHGRVSGLRDFGIFVDLGGADGLVHISELAWHRIDHPREVVKVGDEMDVYVMRVDREEQRISLSRKRLLENPWVTVEQRYAMNQLVEGTITRIVDYGAFAEIEPGIEGLLHVSQLSRGQVESAREVVSEAETHLLRIVSIESARQRIGLSLRAVSASEQIEWMSRKQAEAAEAAEAEAAAAALEEVVVEAVVAEVVAEAAEEVAEEAVEEAVVAEIVAEVAEEAAVEAIDEAVVAEIVAEASEEAAVEAIEEAVVAEVVAEVAEEAAVEAIEEAVVAEAAAAVAEAALAAAAKKAAIAEAAVEAAKEAAAEAIEEAVVAEVVAEAAEEVAEAAVEEAVVAEIVAEVAEEAAVEVIEEAVVAEVVAEAAEEAAEVAIEEAVTAEVVAKVAEEAAEVAIEEAVVAEITEEILAEAEEASSEEAEEANAESDEENS